MKTCSPHNPTEVALKRQFFNPPVFTIDQAASIPNGVRISLEKFGIISIGEIQISNGSKRREIQLKYGGRTAKWTAWNVVAESDSGCHLQAGKMYQIKNIVPTNDFHGCRCYSACPSTTCELLEDLEEETGLLERVVESVSFESNLIEVREEYYSIPKAMLMAVFPSGIFVNNTNIRAKRKREKVIEMVLFCGDASDDLHDASTFMIDKGVRECALELQDTVFLAKLSVWDLISQEAKYHAKYLIKLYNKASRQTPKTKKTGHDTRDIVDPKVANTVKNIEQIRNDKYHEYVRKRLNKTTTPLSDPIKQNKLHLFSRQELRSESKEIRQISSIKQECSLFSQLYVSCQVRDSDIDEFFHHENQAYPPSLSQFGPLEGITRGKHGQDIRRGVQADSTIPGNWESFRRIDDNKTELFAYLAEQLLKLTPSDQTTLVSTQGREIVCNKPNKNNDGLSPLTEDLKVFSDKPNEDCVNEFALNIERFVVLMYDRTSECLRVDAARKYLFTRKGRSIENIPQSSAALHQHIKRAAYQAGFCWGQALVKLQETPSPSNWGWKRNKGGLWEPFWTSLQQVSESCAEMWM
ncbi:unnamed protein product [Mytilus coruscus]|uniref:Uncharacterized protein n=1 Tax=Mytilus coruscus TaxID=42192 RepID=A0A6J8BES1_MYTCO|nr:unnamed protein product [Mytilus coruscus]